jgi:bifunctional non-homologous end joining protein LigD
MPDYRPELCTLAQRAPTGSGWLHEIKLDGYRILARKTAEGARLITRAGKDWTSKFPPLARAVEALPCDSCVLDGEATIVDRDGRTSFQRLQNAIKAKRFGDLAFFAFDLLYMDGHDLTGVGLSDRKRALRGLIASKPGMLRLSDHIEGDGPAVLRKACELGLEGIVSKRADAAYAQSRSRAWLKIKCTRRQEFVIIGWTKPGGSRKHFGALLLAAHDNDGRLVYTGRVGTGFTSASLKDLAGRMGPLARKTCPAGVPPTIEESKGAHWVTPSLVGEVEFTEWTDEGRLRHPSFQGLREDKPASEVRIERAGTARGQHSKPDTRTRGKESSGMTTKNAVTIAGVAVTHPDRVLYPDQGITKGDLAAYYESVADRILPFLKGRPLSTVRCPQGRAKECFFQKHIRDSFGEAVRPLKVQEKGGIAEYISVDSVEGLIVLVQFGVLEIHPWGSTEHALEKPDMLTFDLDPGEGAPFEAVKEAARAVRGFLKTSGGKGLHVVVPVAPEAEWDRAKGFCESIAKGLAHDEPKRYIAKSSKAARTGKVFIDYLRNSRGATSIAPYSTRARKGAPVAMPLRWEELGRLDSPAKYTVENAMRRLSRLKREPWAEMAQIKQSLR